jgi:hypothetical protein
LLKLKLVLHQLLNVLKLQDQAPAVRKALTETGILLLMYKVLVVVVASLKKMLQIIKLNQLLTVHH